MDKLKEAAAIARKKADAATAAAAKAETARQKASEDVDEFKKKLLGAAEEARLKREAWKKSYTDRDKPVPRTFPETSKGISHRALGGKRLALTTELMRRENDAAAYLQLLKTL